MKARIFIGVLMLVMALGFSYSSAQVPGMINYQGMLAESDGSPLDTTVSMTFRIYADSTTFFYLWTETYDSVRVEGGMFNILLGSDSSIPDSVFDGSVRYLGLTVGSDDEMTPRRPLVSVGYAYHTLGADMADMALGVAPDAVGTEQIADGTIEFADIGNNQASPGQVIKWSDAKAGWIPSDDAVGGISGVSGGAGINVSGGSDSVEVSIADGGVTSSMLAGNSVTSDKIGDGEINTDDLHAGAVATDKLSNSAVTNDKLASDAVTNDKLSINAVTNEKLASDAVTNDKLSINAVTSEKLSSNAVTNDKLSINAVTSEKLNANAVSAEKIQVNAVTSDKIADATIQFADIGQNEASPGQVIKWSDSKEGWIAGEDETGGISEISGGAGINVSGGPDLVEVSIADGGVTGSMLAGNSVTSDKIGNGEIKSEDLEVGAVVSDKLSNGAVTSDKLDDNAVNSAKIQGNAVTSDKIGDGEIKTADLNTDAVVTDKLLNGAVTSEKLNANAVSTDKIQVDAVTSDKIADATIQFADIGQNGASDGQVMKWGGTSWIAAYDDTGEGNGWVHSEGLVQLEVLTDDVGIGMATPQAKLDVAGSVRMQGFEMPTAPTQTGYVLTSDDNGVGSWQPDGLTLPYEQTISTDGPAFKVRNEEGGEAVHGEGHIGVYGTSYDGSGIAVWGENTSTAGGLAGRFDGDVQVNGDVNFAGSMDVNGTVHMDGFDMYTPTQAGYVLTSDDNGVGTWQPSTGLTLSYSGSVSTSGTAFEIDNTNNYGVGIKGRARGHGTGVYGECYQSATGVAVYGFGHATATGIYGFSPDGFAGEFEGDVEVTGTLSKGGGSFKIDHPLDPENKYLYHSFVESPDMMNVYNGNVLLDDTGEAWIDLPEWFEALNKDFRYQLTCIGDFAPVYIAEKISNNRFKISGGKPGMEVSWQVTGIRHDAFAEANRIQVEVDKPANEQGKYLYPEAFGVGEEQGIGYDKRRNLGTVSEKEKIEE